MAYYGGYFGYEEEEGEDADKFYGMYDLHNESEWFYSHSNTRLMGSKEGQRLQIDSMLNNELKDTYFTMLPYEMIEAIFILASRLSKVSERWFYQNYFDVENTKSKRIRHLRLTKEQKKLQSQGELMAGVSREHCPGGLPGFLDRRIIYGNNDASICTKELSECIQFGVKSSEGLQKLYTAVKKWFIWICDHSYLTNWKRLMIVIIKKTIEFDERVGNIMILAAQNKSIDPFKTKDDLECAVRIVKDMRYFISHYTPFVLLTRNDIYYEEYEVARCGRWTGDNTGTHDTVYELLSLTNTPLMDINPRDCYEYEMEVYDPEYFYNTYQNYMRLRSGKVLIPSGRVPKFYWFRDRYIKNFV